MDQESPRSINSILHKAARTLRREFEETRAYQHRGEAGGTREKLLSDFLAPRMPGHVMTAHSGEIVATDGGTSAQSDVILYDRSAPPLLDSGDYRIIPNECVYSVIEVKTSLDKGELIESCEKLARVKAMPKTAYYQAPMYVDWNIHGKRYKHLPTLGLIFAYGGTEPSTLAEHLWKWCGTRPVEEWPDGVYVLGKGMLQWAKPGRSVLAYAESDAFLASIKPPSGDDVVFGFMMQLSGVLTRATMWPLNLHAYASSVTLGEVERAFQPPGTPPPSASLASDQG
ncbi:DUF6602 domain-containing protein [Actinomadura nitritigenes]|uniref:DUF6602 domain-containing protein n=1 Tax=Actinomadura nitritigenes TaxID=134602 RepID=UPI003D910B4B